MLRNLSESLLLESSGIDRNLKIIHCGCCVNTALFDRVGNSLREVKFDTFCSTSFVSSVFLTDTTASVLLTGATISTGLLFSAG